MDNIRAVSSFELRVASFKLRHALLAVLLLAMLSVSAHAEYTPYKVRKPVFAGSFYPGDKGTLEKTIEGYFKEVEQKAEKPSSPIFGMMVPHAGYEYSGKVAAYAYSRVKGGSYRTVILLGPSHQVPFRGISVYASGAWETPLGKVEIDEATAQALMKECTAIRQFSPAFEREHSLEVQIPFLQKTLKSFKIVPLVMGFTNENDAMSLANALTALLKRNGSNVLVIASSDMSHYHPYKEAQQMDKLTLKDIEDLNVEKLADRLKREDSELCGANSVITLMMLARRLNARVRVLRYANSGDATGDRARVVGYGAVAFSSGEEQSDDLDTKEQKMLLSMARKTMEEYVQKGTVPQFEAKTKNLLDKRGAFVTLTKNGDLRGCIGYIRPIFPLYRAIIDMTIAASTKDPRFSPVRKEELKDIHVEISVLSPLKPINAINAIEEIEVGKHGLYIVKGDYSGLLLPQVATEYKWNREEFLKQTCLKAGLLAGAWKEKGTEIYIFSAQIFSE